MSQVELGLAHAAFARADYSNAEAAVPGRGAQVSEDRRGTRGAVLGGGCEIPIERRPGGAEGDGWRGFTATTRSRPGRRRRRSGSRWQTRSADRSGSKCPWPTLLKVLAAAALAWALVQLASNRPHPAGRGGARGEPRSGGRVARTPRACLARSAAVVVATVMLVLLVGRFPLADVVVAVQPVAAGRRGTSKERCVELWDRMPGWLRGALGSAAGRRRGCDRRGRLPGLQLDDVGDWSDRARVRADDLPAHRRTARPTPGCWRSCRASPGQRPNGPPPNRAT